MIFLLFLASPLHGRSVFGNWPDSSPVDETVLLLEDIASDQVSGVKEIIKGSRTIHDVINALNGRIDNVLLKLIQVSLLLRTYHPKASMINPIPDVKPLLRGYGLEVDWPLGNYRVDKFSNKLITYIYSGASEEEKFHRMKEVSQIFGKHAQNVARTPTNSDVERLLGEMKPQAIPYNMNGRSVEADPFDILDGMISEIKSMKSMKHLTNMTDEQIDYLHHSPVHYDAPLFLPRAPFDVGAALKSFETDQQEDNLQSHLDLTTNSITKFLLCRKNLVTAQLFVDLQNPNTYTVLKTAIETSDTPSPLNLFVYPVARMNNQTERRIWFAFYNKLAEDGPRDAVKYLIKGFVVGFEKSYDVLPQWELLDQFMTSYSWHFQCLDTVTAYTDNYKIRTNAMFINGEPVLENDIPMALREGYKEWGRIIFEESHNGKIEWDTDMDEFLSDYGVLMDAYSEESFSKEMEYLPFYDLPMNDQKILHDYLKSSKKITEYQSNSTIVTCIKNKEFCDNIRPKSIPITVQYQEELPADISRIIKTDSSLILVGGRMMTTPISQDEFDFAVSYVYKSTNTGIENMSYEDNLYATLWRSSQTNMNIKRDKVPKTTPLTIESGGAIADVVWSIVADPMNPEFRVIMEMANMLLGLIKIRITPIITGHDGIPPHFSKGYYPAFATDGVDLQADDFAVIAPKSWLYHRNGTGVVVDSIAFHVIATNASQIIRIGSQLRKPTDSLGYCMFYLPVGRYRTEGLQQEFFDVDFISNKIPVILKTKTEQVNYTVDYSTINLLSFNTNPGYEHQLKNMLYTAIHNLDGTHPLKFWYFQSFVKSPCRYENSEQLPIVFPPFVPVPNDGISLLKAAKIILLDILFSPEVGSVVFADPGTLFKGDLARFLRLNMKGAAIAIPEAGNAVKNPYWKAQDARNARGNRPFHSSALFYVNLTAWREQGGGEHFRKIYTSIIESREQIYGIDNDLLNLMQNHVQFLTLPEHTAFCDKEVEPSHAQEAFSHILCSKTSVDHAGIDWHALTRNSSTLL